MPGGLRAGLRSLFFNGRYLQYTSCKYSLSQIFSILFQTDFSDFYHEMIWQMWQLIFRSDFFFKSIMYGELISFHFKGMSASFSKNDVNQIEMSKELFGVTGFVFIFESQKVSSYYTSF